MSCTSPHTTYDVMGREGAEGREGIGVIGECQGSGVSVEEREAKKSNVAATMVLLGYVGESQDIPCIVMCNV